MYANQDQECKRTPTPNNVMSNIDQINNQNNQANWREKQKDYLRRTDNQFDSVLEEIEAENKEESDLNNSNQSNNQQFETQQKQTFDYGEYE